jgi:phage shock protein A
MGIIDRVSTLLRANINDLLDRAENPEVMIDQILRDMESGIGDARRQVASMIAQEKELEMDLGETEKLATAWRDKAKRAVGAGKDDLAREALRRQKNNEENAKLYSEQLAVQEQAVTKLKSQLGQLESKYQSTLSQRDAMIARQRRARAQRQVAEAMGQLSPIDPSGDLERLERKIRQDEARAAAMIELEDTSLDAQFAELDYDADIENELEALKSEVTGTGEAIPASTE